MAGRRCPRRGRRACGLARRRGVRRPGRRGARATRCDRLGRGGTVRDGRGAAARAHASRVRDERRRLLRETQVQPEPILLLADVSLALAVPDAPADLQVDGTRLWRLPPQAADDLGRRSSSLPTATIATRAPSSSAQSSDCRSHHGARRADGRRGPPALSHPSRVREPPRSRERSRRRACVQPRGRARTARRGDLRAALRRSGIDEATSGCSTARPVSSMSSSSTATASTASGTPNDWTKLSELSTAVSPTPRSFSADLESTTCSRRLGAASACRRRARTSIPSPCPVSCSIR